MKRSSVTILRTLGLVRAARALQRGRCVILAYHGVLSGGDNRYDFLNHNFVAAEAFEAHIRFLVRHYRPIRLADLVSCYRHQTPPPARSVVVTFDDGFANNYSVAFPILQKYGVPFTIFLTTGMIDQDGAQLWTERVKRAVYLHHGENVLVPLLDRQVSCRLTSAMRREECAREILTVLKSQPPAVRDAAVLTIEDVCGRPPLQPHELERYQFLTWSQVRAMARAGVEFGSHTVTHSILSTLDESSLERELASSKRRIESELEKECHAFAYPNGSRADFGPRDKRALQAIGYTCAVSLRGGLNVAPADLLELDRINVGRNLNGPVFEAALAGLLGRAATVRRNVRRLAAKATLRFPSGRR